MQCGGKNGVLRRIGSILLDRTIGENTELSRVGRGSVAALAVYGIGAGLTYCTQLVIARFIGAVDYGVYAYVFSWMTVLGYFAALGFDVSLLRFVPTYRAREEFGLARGVIRYAERTASMVGIGIAAIGALVLIVFARGLASDVSETFLIGLGLAPIWALMWIRCSTARAFGGVVSALAPERIVRDSVLLICLGILALCLRWQVGARLVMCATVASSAAALGCVSLAARRLRPRDLQNAECRYAPKIWLTTAAPLVLLGTVEPLLNRSGVILLGWMGDVTAAGIYAMAFNIAFLVVLPRTAVNALFAPAAAELFARHDRAALQVLIARTSVWTLVCAVCIAIPLSLLAGPILGLLGRGFEAGALPLRVLLVGQVVAAATGSPLYLMTMTGMERLAAGFLVMSAATNILAGIIFIHQFGLDGAAVATFISLVMWNGMMSLYIWRKLHLVPGILGIRRASGTPGRESLAATALDCKSQIREQDAPRDTSFVRASNDRPSLVAAKMEKL